MAKTRTGVGRALSIATVLLFAAPLATANWNKKIGVDSETRFGTGTVEYADSAGRACVMDARYVVTDNGTGEADVFVELNAPDTDTICFRLTSTRGASSDCLAWLYGTEPATFTGNWDSGWTRLVTSPGGFSNASLAPDSSGSWSFSLECAAATLSWQSFAGPMEWHAEVDVFASLHAKSNGGGTKVKAESEVG